jgi:multiple sugar transport system permease protein
MPSRARHRFDIVPWLFLAPALILFLYFKFIPMAQGVKMSFYDVQTYLGDRWVGMENYRTIVTDERFTNAITNTIVLAAGATIGSMAGGLLLALLVEGKARYLWFVRTAAFIPVVTTIAVAAEVWRIMYYPDAPGPVNSILGWLFIDPKPFIAHEDTSLFSLVAVQIWRGAPYDMMIFVAGLAGVDRALYEQAAVDGASALRRFVHVTVPALRPVFAILFTLAAIRGLRVFTEVFTMTNGGPNGSTEVIMTLIYKLGLQQGHLGVAAAGSVVLFIATVILTIAVRALYRRDARA